jgi:hypothetical protein
VISSRRGRAEEFLDWGHAYRCPQVFSAYIDRSSFLPQFLPQWSDAIDLVNVRAGVTVKRVELELHARLAWKVCVEMSGPHGPDRLQAIRRQ